MIVPAKQKHFDAGRFARGNLKLGESFSVDSCLGGSFTVEFKGYEEGGALVFSREARNEWPQAYWVYDTPEDAAKALYILVPENPHQIGGAP